MDQIIVKKSISKFLHYFWELSWIAKRRNMKQHPLKQPNSNPKYNMPFKLSKKSNNEKTSVQTPNFVRATVFIFSLGFGSVCDEFRIWVSNLVRFYFNESLSHFGLVIYFVFNCLFVVKCHVVFVSYHVMFFIFIYVKYRFI